MTRALVMIALLIVALFVGCGAPDIPPPPPHDAGLSAGDALQKCELTTLEGDPANCLAVWGCPDLGALTLGCGTDTNGNPICVCVEGEARSTTVNTTPTSCSDVQVVTAFARDQCGWTLP